MNPLDQMSVQYQDGKDRKTLSYAAESQQWDGVAILTLSLCCRAGPLLNAHLSIADVHALLHVLPLALGAMEAVHAPVYSTALSED